jgi:aminoglycoside phosphotransferase (APT) family kinase protein
VLWEDRDNYAFAMAAAPEAHQTWKEMLLSGQTVRSLSVAVAVAQLLGRLHGGTWSDSIAAKKFDDRTYFDQLRLDPYYRHIASRHADLAPQLGSLIDSVLKHRQCLVHGDFSPKNLLVWPGCVMLIDCEVGHFGDPAFDLGFFLTHLVLKALWSGPRRKDYLNVASAFWQTYRSALASSLSADELAALESRAMFNLAGCLLARVDGKSPVDYLTAEQQELVRRLGIAWLRDPPRTWNDAHERLLSTPSPSGRGPG